MAEGGGGGGTTTSTDEMAVFQKKADDVAQQLTGMLTTMLNGLSPLESNWQGGGGTSFVTTKATVQNEITRLNGALTGMSADVGTAGVTYASSDQDARAVMDKVNSTNSGITSALSPA